MGRRANSDTPSGISPVTRPPFPASPSGDVFVSHKLDQPPLRGLPGTPIAPELPRVTTREEESDERNAGTAREGPDPGCEPSPPAGQCGPGGTSWPERRQYALRG